MLHGSHFDCAKMLIESRSHQLGKGQSSSAEMPCVPHPSRPVYGSQRVSAEMSHCTHSHQLGEGQAIGAAMPLEICPSPPVYGRVRRDPQQCHGDCTLPPVRKGHNLYAHQAATVSPFPINLREPIELRRNANLNYLPPDLGHQQAAEMPLLPRPI